MTRKNKKKDARRARQAKLGGSYCAHLRMLEVAETSPTLQRDGRLAPPERFEALVHGIIALAKSRNEEEELSPDRSVEESIFGPPLPAEAALDKALSELPYPILRKLEVLMYSGREGIGVVAMERTLLRNDADVTASMIAEKLPLDEYLTAGLRLAKVDGVDLEGSFSRPRRTRAFRVHGDRETPAHTGAEGMVQVIALLEAADDEVTRDVTHLVDQGVLFGDLEDLRAHLARVTGDEVEIEEV